MTDNLAALFDYDLWANRLWAEYLVVLGRPEPESSIFRHIFAAQEAWLARIDGQSPSEMPTPEADEATMRRLHGGWVEVLASRDHAEVIPFRRTTGEEYEATIGDIARHVINHGTYHRGELRGMARAAGVTDFPETDLIKFVLARSQG